jgi:hypothetical protein
MSRFANIKIIVVKMILINESCKEVFPRILCLAYIKNLILKALSEKVFWSFGICD